MNDVAVYVHSLFYSTIPTSAWKEWEKSW